MLDLPLNPKRLVKGSFESLEAYNFPPPGRPGTNGYSFRSAESDVSRVGRTKIGHSDVANARRIAQCSEPMSTEHIAAIDRILQGVLFMIDCDLCQPHDAEVFEQFFGDQALRETKDWFLAQVREMVSDLLNRPEPANVTYLAKLRIVEVGKFEHSIMCEARTSRGRHRQLANLEIHRRVREKRRSIDEFYLTRLELTKDDLFSYGFHTQEGILLHELVHYVSGDHWQELISRLGMGPFPFVDNVINTVDCGDPANTQGPGRIVDVAFDQKPGRDVLINDYVQHRLRTIGHMKAYGHASCCVFAHDSPGKKGAIFNADSWSLYVQARAYNFLGQVLRPDEDSELMKHDDSLLRSIRDQMRPYQEALQQGMYLSVPEDVNPFAVREFWFKHLDGGTQAFYRQKQETVRQLMQIKPVYEVKSTSKPWYADGHHSQFFRIIEKMQSESKRDDLYICEAICKRFCCDTPRGRLRRLIRAVVSRGTRTGHKRSEAN